MLYKHTQIGYVILVSMGVAAFVLLTFTEAPPAWLLGILCLLTCIFFATLTISVDAEYIRIFFGLGLIRRQFKLEDIETCQVTPHKCWRWGWGIHGWPGKCWIYNVSGFHTVELKMKSGIKYYLGTDEPGKLEKAIQDGMHQSLHRSIKID